MSTYREPGVYSEIVSKRKAEAQGRPLLMPMIIGSGATEMRRTEVITRGSEEYDVLPTAAKTIISVGYSTKKADFSATTDYQLDEVDKTHLKWVSEGNAPLVGESYSVTYTYMVTADQYLPKVITADTLEAAYGKDLKEDGGVNNIVLAANIMFETGVEEVIMLQVKPSTTNNTVGAEEYKAALEEHAQFIDPVFRIVPVDEGEDINKVIDEHVATCSTYEERKERCVVYCYPKGEQLSSANQIISTIGEYAESKNEERIVVTYPNRATRVFSDGVVREVTGAFIACAFAALEASKPVCNSKTRSATTVFNEILGIKLTRTQKNALAAKGVLIFEQPDGAGEDIICRHQLTTNMESIETKECSIAATKDYVSKYMRKGLDVYIGKYNITADLITKINGSANSLIAELVKDGYLLTGSITSIAQDELNPDSIIIEMMIDVPYPCNSIKITIVL